MTGKKRRSMNRRSFISKSAIGGLGIPLLADDRNKALSRKEGHMMKDSIIDVIGNTPLVFLNKIGKECQAILAAKLELFNPMSVKDRAALYMIRDGERKGFIKKGTTIIEASSGNTGVALAYICAIKDYRLIICMNEAMSEERKRILRIFGAELELTPPGRHTAAARERAMELADKIPNSYYINQHGNPANREAHVETTAEEIWKDSDGKVDIIVAGLGTTGTALGMAKALKPRKPGLRVVGVEPLSAPMLSKGLWTEHKLIGTSPGFVPDLYKESVIDEIVLIDTEKDAYHFCRRLAKEEGMLVGVSSGATAAAAIKLGQRPENKGKLIICIFADSGQRYLSVNNLF